MATQSTTNPFQRGTVNYSVAPRPATPTTELSDADKKRRAEAIKTQQEAQRSFGSSSSKKKTSSSSTKKNTDNVVVRDATLEETKAQLQASGAEIVTSGKREYAIFRDQSTGNIREQLALTRRVNGREQPISYYTVTTTTRQPQAQVDTESIRVYEQYQTPVDASRSAANPFRPQPRAFGEQAVGSSETGGLIVSQRTPLGIRITEQGRSRPIASGQGAIQTEASILVEPRREFAPTALSNALMRGSGSRTARQGAFGALATAAASPTAQAARETATGFGKSVAIGIYQAPGEIYRDFRASSTKIEQGTLMLGQGTFGRRQVDAPELYRQQGFQNIVEGTGELQFEFGQGYAAGEAIGKSARFLKNIYIRTGTKEVPLSSLTTEEVTTGFSRGAKKIPMPKSRTRADLIASFEDTRVPEVRVKPYTRRQDVDVFVDNPNLAGNRFIIERPVTVKASTRGGQVRGVTASPDFLKTEPGQKNVVRVRVGEKGLIGEEDPGQYFAPVKKASVGFTRIAPDVYSRAPEYSLNPFASFIDVFSRTPTVTTVTGASRRLVRIPQSQLEVPGFSGLRSFYSQNKGSFVIPKRSELAYGRVRRQFFAAEGNYIDPWTKRQVRQGQRVLEKRSTEAQSVLAEDTRYRYTRSRQKGLRGIVARFKGYQEYTMVADTAVPLPRGRVINPSRRGIASRLSDSQLDDLATAANRAYYGGSSAARTTRRVSVFPYSRVSRAVSQSSSASMARQLRNSSSILDGSSSRTPLNARRSTLPFGGAGSSIIGSGSSSSFFTGGSSSVVIGGRRGSVFYGGTSSSVTSGRQSIVPITDIARRRPQRDEPRRGRRRPLRPIRDTSITRYTPTAYAASFNIRGRALSGQLSGLEFRGVA